MKIVLNTDTIPDGVCIVGKIVFLIVCGALIGVLLTTVLLGLCSNCLPEDRSLIAVLCGVLGGQIMLLWVLS